MSEPEPNAPEARRPNVRLSFAWFLVAAMLLMVDWSTPQGFPTPSGNVTYYVVAKQHWVVTFPAAFALFGALYLGMTPRFPIRLRPALGWIHFGVMAVGAALIKAPVLGLRWTDPSVIAENPVTAFDTWNRFAVTGYVLLLVGLAVFVVALVDGLLSRRRPSGSR